MKLLFVLILVNINIAASQKLSTDDRVLRLIKGAGYIGEAHEVETEDGYLLKIHRVLPAIEKSPRPTVLLLHGAFATSAEFLILGHDSAMAYLLSDNGYDVWMGNVRGNFHSEKHKTLDPKSSAFWKFSWHEMGIFDLPAMINYILIKSNVSNVFFVGHSQGATALMVLLSERPEFNRKIVQAHLAAPPVLLKHQKFLPAETAKAALELSLSSGVFYFDLTFCNSTFTFLKQSTCADLETSDVNCKHLFSATLMIMGDNPTGIQMDPRVLEIAEIHISPRASIMQALHYVQVSMGTTFKKFDFKFRNILHYGTQSTPIYKLENVIVPVHLYHAQYDKLVSREDVEDLKENLPNIKSYRIIPNWNHIDFFFAKNARKVLYFDILNHFEKERK